MTLRGRGNQVWDDQEDPVESKRWTTGFEGHWTGAVFVVGTQEKDSSKHEKNRTPIVKVPDEDPWTFLSLTQTQ